MSYKAAVRIVIADFYMSQPVQDLDVMYSDFRGASVHQVPLVRIFGSTDSGKKICLHVHGVFPYLYIPYDGAENVNVLKYQIAASIDKAINVSFGQASSNAQHIYKIELVSGIPFYGYHVRRHQFLKIFLYNPMLIRKVGMLLQNEVILGKLYQPHELHVPYILQFMIDYNLHGMSRILLADVKFRTDLAMKQSYCELEADAFCEDILNRLEVSSNGNMGINPGIAALWADEKQRLRNQDEDSEIGQCLTLENSQVEPTKSHQLFKQALLEKLVILGENVADSECTNQNISVYPAVTPDDTDLKEASFIDFHSPQLASSSESMNDSFDLDATLIGNDKLLFDILQGLAADNNAAKIRADEDSILSQIPKEDDEIDEEDEYLNRSMAETTPIKNIYNDFGDDLNLSWDPDLDMTLVPQLDGQNDSNSDDERGNKIRKRPKREAKVKCKFKPLPILVSPIVKNGNKVYQEPEPKRNIDETLEAAKRQLSFQSETTMVCEDIIECQYKPGEPNHERISNVTFSAADTKEIDQSILSVAQIYDIETNFIPKEGCSTVLTQSSNDSLIDLFYNSQHSDKLTPQEKQFQSSSESDMFKHLSSECSDCITPKLRPPSPDEVLTSLEELKLPYVIHKKPFYSDITDVAGSVEIGHTILKVTSNTTAHLDDFKTYFNGFDKQRGLFVPEKVNMKTLKLSFCGNQSCIVTPLKEAPSVQSVEAWLKNNRLLKANPMKRFSSEKQKIYIPSSPGDDNDSDMDLSLTLTQDYSSNENCDEMIMPSPRQVKSGRNNSARISGVTLNNTFGFKNSPFNCQEAKTVNEFQHLTIFSMEVHVPTRGDLKPDPTYDEVKAIFYSIVEDSPNPYNRTGVIVNGCDFKESEVRGSLQCVENENELFEALVRLIQEMDPDILTGYETELLSWGYVLERAQVVQNPLLASMSRIKNYKISKNEDRSLIMTGRIILDFWRLLRHEVALQSYTFENIVYQILQRRVPEYSFQTLTVWWNHSLFRHRTTEYYIYRVEAIIKIMEQLDLIGRTSELARLFGIQFYEVLSRGSQFRVESMMLRLAKPMNYIPVSPSVEQRAKMKAPEFLPLILEPESKFYIDPVIVLDFQSLYPSIIIAYNYCFSTCIGKVMHLGGKDVPFEFGATQYKISRDQVYKLLKADALNFSPCGVAFVKKSTRDGIMPRMLREILDTRLMVKKSMKKNKNNKLLQKVLHNRQLGLKLIANVTYGYTAASFSGRMPAVELADSVVSKGRETLQRAISLVENTKEWGARVVYGDTDSLFVMTPGRSKSDAFEIGRQIADAVTADNPDPVKLKLEKVYYPCILQTKKRYVGYMYESVEQTEPVYDAKGIETVRRDGCPAVSKMLEKCLRLLFETKDASLVKQYVLRQFNKILTGRVSLQDLTFAKEYRGAAGYRPGACVPALQLSRKWTAIDKRNEPRTKERVPYIIANGPPGVPLIRLVRSPRDFLNDPSLRPNAIYYITKVIIPPINRCFNLVGINVTGWFNQMPRKQLHYLATTSPSPMKKKSTISQYFSSTSCAACGEQTQTDLLCLKCKKTPQQTVFVLMEKIRRWEHAFCTINTICESCTGILEKNICTSLDCPILYRVNQASRDFQQADYVRHVIGLLEGDNR